MTDRMAATTYSPRSPSSGGAESYRCTPGTKLTDYSPEDFRGQSKMGYHGNSITNHPPAFTLHGVPLKFSPHSKAPNLTSMGTQDPFTVTSSTLQVNGNAASGIKLSPTAVAFKPSQSGFHLAATLRSEPIQRGVSLPGPGQHQNAQQDARSALRVSYLNATSVPELDLSHTKLTQNILSVAGDVNQSPIGPPASSNCTILSTSTTSSPTDSVSRHTNCSRYLRIRVPTDTTQDVLNVIFINLSSPTPKLVVISKLTTEGFIFVRFSDLRDAKQAYSTLKHTQTDWLMQFVDVKYFVLNYKPHELAITSDFEGQIQVTALCEGKALRFNPQLIAHLVKEMLGNYGDLMAFSIYSVTHPSITVLAEYYDVEAAEKAVMQLNGFRVSTYILTVTHYAPDLVDSRAISTPKSRGPLIMGNGESDLKSSFGHLSVSEDHSRLNSTVYGSNGSFQGYISSPSTPGYTARDRQQNSQHSNTYSYPHHEMPSLSWQACAMAPVGQRMMPQNLQGYLGPVAQRQYGPYKNGPRHNHEFASGHHNVVDIERIRQGLDVRTTIMLRNIPNKIDQAMLKEIVDDTSRGMYDFMYLRIDFANNCKWVHPRRRAPPQLNKPCSVGYAFINFEDPYCIIDFVKARAGRRWNRFNSDKIAEVSYATIQGKDCLVQKFRNSSVMLEHPSFRPKIFHTGKDALSGKEEKFPGPDNPSKMRRSVENAEHVVTWKASSLLVLVSFSGINNAEVALSMIVAPAMQNMRTPMDSKVVRFP
ncbi:hypothetical protein MMC27_004546 [Xylographa pallens]|nr:hypothetical protein [Xylographa pallens]